MTYIDTFKTWKEKMRYTGRSHVGKRCFWYLCDAIHLDTQPLEGKRVGFIRDEDEIIDCSDANELYESWLMCIWEGKYQDPCDYPVSEEDREWHSNLRSYKVKSERVVSPTTGDRGWKITFTTGGEVRWKS